MSDAIPLLIVMTVGGVFVGFCLGHLHEISSKERRERRAEDQTRLRQIERDCAVIRQKLEARP